MLYIIIGGNTIFIVIYTNLHTLMTSHYNFPLSKMVLVKIITFSSMSMFLIVCKMEIHLTTSHNDFPFSEMILIKIKTFGSVSMLYIIIGGNTIFIVIHTQK